MTDHDKSAGMKSAYEVALERLQEDGIEPPRREGLAPETQARIAEVRRRTEARLAQLEILREDRLRKTHDPAERETAERDYRSERERLESKRDREIESIRSAK